MNHAKFCPPAQGWSTPNLNDSDVLLRGRRSGETPYVAARRIYATALRATFSMSLNRLTTVRGNRCGQATSR
jgi:hypothetical protein